MRNSWLTKGKCIVGFLMISFIFGCGMAAGQYMVQEKATDMINTETEQSSNEKINLNTADYDTLISLDGIDETTAKAIIDFRLANGGFNTLEDLVILELIPESVAEDIADDVVVEFP